MSELLAIQNVNVSYGDSPILRGVSISVAPNEIMGVVGESGSGKSTTIYAALGILRKGGRVTGGSIKYCGSELLSLSSKKLRELRGSEISLIAQSPVESFHPIRRVRSQLHELVKAHGGLSYGEADARFKEILAKMELHDGDRILDSYAYEMSGGMCQRVSIAMSMVLHPKLILADEPTSALDVTVQKQVVSELVRLRDDYGNSIMIVSHNMGVISCISDSIAVMYAGMVLEHGTKEMVIRTPLHPYTKALIAAIPSMHRPIPRGIVPSEFDRSFFCCPYCKGCSFSVEQCRSEIPSLYETDTGHFVRCHLFKKV